MPFPRLNRTACRQVTLALVCALACAAPSAAQNGGNAVNTDSLIDVAAHGALPNDVHDDASAIRAAIDAARAAGAGGIRFAPGRYDLEAGPDPALFTLKEIAGFTIDGGGAEFFVHGTTGVFALAGCRDITIRGLSVDFARLPYSVGTVTDAADTHFDVDVFPDYPVQGGEPVQAFMDYDPDTLLPCPQGLDVYALGKDAFRTELLGPQKLRVFTPRNTGIRTGVLAVLRHQVYDRSAFVFSRSRDIAVRDIAVYTCPGMGLVAAECHNVSLERFNVLRKPGTRRPVSATADASHFSGCTGDVTIRDCTFEGMGDDAVNAKTGLYLAVLERVDDHTVLARHNLRMQCLPDPGDRLELTPPDTLIPYGTAVVRDARLESDSVTHRVTFEEALPEALKPGDLLGNASRNPRLHISGCTVHANRARGFLLQTRDAVVENCTFQDVTSGGIMVIAEVTHFYESIPARQVVIRNNRFIHCNYGGPLCPGVITIAGILKGFAYATTPGVFHDITFEGNTIETADNAAIFVAGAEGLTLRNNTVTGVCRKPTDPRCRSAIALMGSRDVHLEGNRILRGEQGEGCDAVLTLGEGTDAPTITLTANTGF